MKVAGGHACNSQGKSTAPKPFRIARAIKLITPNLPSDDQMPFLKLNLLCLNSHYPQSHGHFQCQ